MSSHLCGHSVFWTASSVAAFCGLSVPRQLESAGRWWAALTPEVTEGYRVAQPGLPQPLALPDPTGRRLPAGRSPGHHLPNGKPLNLLKRHRVAVTSKCKEPKLLAVIPHHE